MAIKFQYNKTSLQQLEKNLKMRHRTLPIIKNKESALRMEVKRCKEEVEALAAELETRINACNRMFALWNEFDASIVSIESVETGTKKIAGVKVPVLSELHLKVARYSMFTAPKWYYDGIEMVRSLAKVAIEHEFAMVKLQLLDHTRRKTTQKVNLFEKVQIPGFQDAIRKIKRFMEDEENLSKSSQKILKTLQEKRKQTADAAANGKEDAA